LTTARVSVPVPPPAIIYIWAGLGKPGTRCRAAERKLENTDFLTIRYYLAFFKGDQVGMEREIDLARGKPGAESSMPHHFLGSGTLRRFAPLPHPRR